MRGRLAMHDWAGFEIAKEHYKELLREAEKRRLVREARRAAGALRMIRRSVGRPASRRDTTRTDRREAA
jgi:hypothetical protein